MSAREGTKGTANGSGSDRIAELLTLAELAEFLKVPNKTVYAWKAKDPTFPYLKVGRYLRFERAKILQYFNERTEEGKPCSANSFLLRDFTSRNRSLKNHGNADVAAQKKE